ncbi:MAG: DUF952 domain-containing protein [Bacteriovoracaceae bacterium]|nr:DUF952 domain-containing protein [Bacteriovoracaceae bacterium]
MKIFHIVPRDEWNDAKKAGTYRPVTMDNEGFIHCSKADQLLGVANSFFKGQENLIVLRIDQEKVKPEIKIEPPLEAPMSSMLFPHIYGELNLDCVEAEITFKPNDDGRFSLPENLLD